MRQKNDTHVLEAQPEDIIDYLEGDELAGAVGTVMNSIGVAFRPSTHATAEEDVDITPVLNARGIKSLAEASPVRWNISGEEIILLLDHDRMRDDATKELKEAFGAHGRGDVDIDKNPRRLWNEHTEE